MKLDFLLCGSATDAFFSQIAFFRLCLNALGGVYSDARVVAVFGDHEVEMLPGRWRRYFDGIEVEWDSSSPKDYENMDKYAGRHYRRFELVRADADLAILCDADVAVLKPFDKLIGDLTSRPAIAGVIAHFHFTWDDPDTDWGRRGDPDTDWSEISRSILGKDIEMPYQYSLMEGDPDRCPFYINYGVFIGTPDLLREFHRSAIQLEPKVFQTTKSWFSAQITVPLVCAALELPTRSLPMRYNFPNDDLADTMYPEEMEDIRFLHYLRTHEFDRHQIFSDERYFDEFMNRKMKGSNEIFRRHAYELLEGRYPFSEFDNGCPVKFSNKIDGLRRWIRSLRSTIRTFRR